MATYIALQIIVAVHEYVYIVYINYDIYKTRKRYRQKAYLNHWHRPREHCFVPVFFTALLALAAPKGLLDVDFALALAS